MRFKAPTEADRLKAALLELQSKKQAADEGARDDDKAQRLRAEIEALPEADRAAVLAAAAHKMDSPQPLRPSNGMPSDIDTDARTLPFFVTNAHPVEVPAALLELPPNCGVRTRHNFPPYMEANRTAADYREDIEARIARQFEGFFTLYEAAQILADAHPGADAREAAERFRLAHSNGRLPIHQSGSRFPLEPGEAVSYWRDLLEVAELDAWMRASTGYGFPPAAVGQFPTVPAAAPETPKQRRTRLLAIFDAESAAGREYGAVARIAKMEKRNRPTADRSNIGKDIKKARQEREAERRGGALARMLG